MKVAIQLTSAPGIITKTLTLKSKKVDDMVAKAKDEWPAIQTAAKDSKNNLAMAFAEIEVDGKYDDELSGKVTFALEALFAPKVPVAAQKPVSNTKAPVTRRVTPQGNTPNKASQVRSMVADNPKADAAQLMEMVEASDIGIPKGKIKDYVIGSIKTVRG